MSVGINVYEQLKAPWTGYGTNLSSPPPAGPYCANHVILDTWAENLSITSKTLPFFNAFLGGLEYPMYTAATYDQAYTLKACLEATASWNATTLTGQVKADDVIAWFENLANAQLTTTGLLTCTYPVLDAFCTNGTPALSLAQKNTLYGTSWTYHANEWGTPPCTTHDLVYGPTHSTGIGAQWQWDAGAAKWKKLAIWPRVIPGYVTADQYGEWGFAYNGTVPTVIPANVIAHNFS